MPPPWPPPPHPPLPHLLLAILTALLLLAFPPRALTHRLFLFALFCLPAGYAFFYHQHLTPWYGVNDTLGRFVYIWGVHVSWVVLLLGAGPVDEEGREAGYVMGMEVKWRVGWAWKVLFARRVGGYWPRWVGREEMETVERGDVAVMVYGKKEHGGLDGNMTTTTTTTTPPPPPSWRRREEPPHNLSLPQFTLNHTIRLLLYSVLDYTWTTHISPHPTTNPLTTRLLMTWDTCISDALSLSTHYSLSALLIVSILHLDSPAEWSLSIFGSLADCYTVRRYWGVYWHDYIGASFAAHAQLFTRRGMRWRRPSAGRRVVENTLVFAASGVGHAAVRYVGTEGRGEVWTVALWYVAQMLPIVGEGCVGYVWVVSGARGRAREWVGEGWLGRVERLVGYVWVFGWMVWSVPLYLRTRNRWEMEAWKERMEMFGGAETEGVSG